MCCDACSVHQLRFLASLEFQSRVMSDFASIRLHREAYLTEVFTRGAYNN